MTRKKPKKLEVPARVHGLVTLASHDGTPQHERENAAVLACKLLAPLLGDPVEEEPPEEPLR